MDSYDSNPLQSIIIPTYNRKDFIADAINSVLSQTQKSLEIIVVDDCSSDGTGDFVKSFTDERIRYFRNEQNLGLERNRSVGLRHARGKYITWLDDDDYYTDDKFFEKAINIFTEHESDEVPLVMVCANAKTLYMQTNETEDSYIGRPGRIKGLDYIIFSARSTKNLCLQKPLSTFPTIFRADVLRGAGLENKIIFDRMTYIEAALEGDAWFMPDVIGVYRVHAQNMTAGGFKSKNPEREARHYATLMEDIRRYKHVKDILAARTDKKTAEDFYIFSTLRDIGYVSIARPSLKDRIKSTMCLLQVSGFMPKLWLNVPLKLWRYIMKKFRARKR